MFNCLVGGFLTPADEYGDWLLVRRLPLPGALCPDFDGVGGQERIDPLSEFGDARPLLCGSFLRIA
jgi:hypothetical protein